MATADWTIERDARQPHARATAGAGATVRALAGRIGLDPGEAAGWLHPEAGADAPVEEGRAFRVPNTVLMLWVGDLGALGRADVAWDRNRQYLARRGYHVVAEIYEGRRVGDGSRGAILDQVGGLSAAGALYGFQLTGHGWPWGFALKGGISNGYRPPRHAVDYGDFERRLRYHLGLVILNTCNGGWSRADALPGGAVIGAGGRDLVAAAPGAMFHGVKRILIPQIFLWQADTKHVWDLLPPGTRPPQTVG